jgi:hypothetical protein
MPMPAQLVTVFGGTGFSVAAWCTTSTMLVLPFASPRGTRTGRYDFS